MDSCRSCCGGSNGRTKKEWSPGRIDKRVFDRPDSAVGPEETSKIIVPENGRLPQASRGADHIRKIFSRMGFNDQETVALLGAHCVGRAHKERSGYQGPWTNTPILFYNSYFKFLVERNWIPKEWDGPLQFVDSNDRDEFVMMLPTDLALLKDSTYRILVNRYAVNNQLWMDDFGRAYSKLLELGVTRD
jgi:catalase (peroxidase I)